MGVSHPPLTSTPSSKALIVPALHEKDGPAGLHVIHLPSDLLSVASQTRDQNTMDRTSNHKSLVRKIPKSPSTPHPTLPGFLGLSSQVQYRTTSQLTAAFDRRGGHHCDLGTSPTSESTRFNDGYDEPGNLPHPSRRQLPKPQGTGGGIFPMWVEIDKRLVVECVKPLALPAHGVLSLVAVAVPASPGGSYTAFFLQAF